jgi:hypothetical protein
LITAFACQKALDLDKELSTTVSGTVMQGRGYVSAKITADTFDTTSDATGKYSLTVIHNGSFNFKVDYGAGKYVYTEKIATKEISLVRDIKF